MKRHQESEHVVAEIRLKGCPEGPVLQPLEEKGEVARRHFPGWETPLAPWGGFGLDSGLAVVRDGDQLVLEWTMTERERAMVSGPPEGRDYRVVASVRPLDTAAPPHIDRADCSEALVGVVFRVTTSRHYYQFGVEGKRRAVLYRRADDEWLVLAEQEVQIPDDYVTLEVNLDGDGIRCRCDELGVAFFVTDTMFPTGKAGGRAIGRARVATLRITMTPAQEQRTARRRRVQEEEARQRAVGVPDPVLVRTLDLNELGGTPQFVDFAYPGRYDMLIAGDTLKAMTLDGEVLWTVPETVRGVVWSAEHADQGRLLYGFTGARSAEARRSVTGANGQAVVSDEMCVIRGMDGEILTRQKLPLLDEAVRITAFTSTSGNLSGSGDFDIVLREWRRDAGDGGFNLWAYDRDLNLLWTGKVNAPYGHGHAVQFYDVDGDGLDELLAGGTLFSPDGRVIWVHDRESEMAHIPGAHHYDAVAIGAFADDPSVDPAAFLLGGSAGVYVVDGRTGETRMIHRIGHAQGRSLGRVRGNLPGTQILTACRWGNMGILTLFSGQGDRLWSIQPDYIGQGSCPVIWGDSNVQLIWANTSGPVQAFYDGYGRLVKKLPALERLWGGRMRRAVGTKVARMGDDPTELLCVTVEGKLYAFGPGDS